MGIFSKNIKINSDEYEKLIKRIVENSADIEELKKKLDVLTTNYNSLRGLINRRLGGKDLEERPQDLNNSIILPYNGNFQ